MHMFERCIMCIYCCINVTPHSDQIITTNSLNCVCLYWIWTCVNKGFLDVYTKRAAFMTVSCCGSVVCGAAALQWCWPTCSGSTQVGYVPLRPFPPHLQMGWIMSFETCIQSICNTPFQTKDLRRPLLVFIRGSTCIERLVSACQPRSFCIWHGWEAVSPRQLYFDSRFFSIGWLNWYKLGKMCISICIQSAKWQFNSKIHCPY